MSAADDNPYTTHFIPKGTVSPGPRSGEVELHSSRSLDSDLAKWRRKGYSLLGLSDVLEKAGTFGFSGRLKQQAERVGAEVVLFCIWPAKLKSVKREQSGEIDLDALVADLPSSFSPRSYAVTRALFLAQTPKGR